MRVPINFADPEATIGPTRYIGQTLPAHADYPRAVDVFSGIPFGTGTAGRARFRRATMYTPTTPGAVYARDAGHTAPATGQPDGHMGEDCLNAQITRSHVWGAGGTAATAIAATADMEAARLPVLVFFHGGAFNFGSGLTRNMRALVAWAQRPLVVVAVNYRLGVLGFPTAGERDGGDDDEDGAGVDSNVGVWDMQLALEWVQKHVAAFGGDKDNVTVMGVSAGAHGVGHLLNALPTSSSLFHRAILESGSPSARAILSPTHPRVLAQHAALLRALSLPPTTPSSALRRLPFAALTTAAGAVWAANEAAVRWPFQPTLAPPLTPTPPSAAVHDTPLLTGFCTHEGAVFIPHPLPTGESVHAFFRALIPGPLSAADLCALDALYPPPDVPGSIYAEPPPVAGYGAHWRRAEAAYADWAYITPVLRHASTTRGRVHVYEWAALGGALRMAQHTAEGPAVEHNMEVLRGHGGLEAVAAAMHGAVVGFIADGDIDQIDWPEFVAPWGDKTEADGSKGRGQIVVFGEGNDELAADSSGSKGVAWRVREMTEREKAACEFWWARRHLSEGDTSI